jgi:hypothetical protein
MSIASYKEITKWADDPSGKSNKIYLFDGKSNALAYSKDENSDIFIFKKPLALSTKGRKFIKIKHKALDEYGATVALEPPPVANNVTSFSVLSDSGKTYVVNVTEGGSYTCNCVGFAYRGKCKHSDSVAKEQQSTK